MNPISSPLLTDLYQLTMLQAYYEHRMTDIAVFDLLVRKLPPGRNFLVAAGLEQAFGIPVFGTMAHSFVQAHEHEGAAFERFADEVDRATAA